MIFYLIFYYGMRMKMNMLVVGSVCLSECAVGADWLGLLVDCV